MTDKEFWEDDPQLYWSYLILYQKQKEIEAEEMKYECWLNGKLSYIAYSCALNNAFSKGRKETFPDYEKVFKKRVDITEKEKNAIITRENNFWARR